MEKAGGNVMSKNIPAPGISLYSTSCMADKIMFLPLDDHTIRIEICSYLSSHGTETGDGDVGLSSTFLALDVLLGL